MRIDRKTLSSIERFNPDRFVHIPVFTGERTKVILLCLAPKLAVPPHEHPGHEVVLEPLRGKAVLPMPTGEVTLEPGDLYLLDGAQSFELRNPFDAPFEMLITRVRR